MAKIRGIGFLKLILFSLIIINSAVHSVFAQLDTIHWIPPLHSRDNSQIAKHFVYLSTPITTPFVVTIKDGAGNILATPSVSNAIPFVYQVGNGQNPGTPSFVPIDSLNVILKSSGLILTAPQVFYANLRVQSAAQADCLSAKGRAAAGTTFRVGGFPMSLTGQQTSWDFSAGIMATANNTTVTISGYNPGVVFADGSSPFSSPSLTFALNQGECYVVAGYTNTAANLRGFIGALVQSNNPIVLNNGNLLGNITNAGAGGQDIGIDQSVPVNKIGQQYVLIEGNGSPQTEIPIVIAHYNNTDIFVNGNPVPIATINAGQYYMVPNANYQGVCNQNMHIRTSQPAYMYQSLAGAAANETNALNFIPPYGCGLPDTIDNIPFVEKIGTTTYTGGVMIFTQQGATLKINGVVQTCAEPVLSAPWETYYITGLTGNITITSTGGVAAGIFGKNGNAGYAGYYAGFSSFILPSAGTDTAICNGSSITLDGNGSGNYNWSPSTGLSNTTIANPVANPTSTTTYTVIVTDSKGCSSNASVTVKVNQFPVTNISSQVNVSCNSGSNGSAAVSASGGVPPYTFSWYPSGGTNAIATGLSAGFYTVTVTDSIACNSSTQTVTITQPTV